LNTESTIFVIHQLMFDGLIRTYQKADGDKE